MKAKYAVINWKVAFGAMFHHLSANTADDMEEFIGANLQNGLIEGELDRAFAVLLEGWVEIDNGGRPRAPTVKALLWAVKDLRAGRERGAICIGCRNAGWIFDAVAEDYPNGAFVPCDCPAGTKVMYSQFPNADHQEMRRKARFLMAQIPSPPNPSTWFPRLLGATPAQRWEIICEPDNTEDSIRLEHQASAMVGGVVRPEFGSLPSPFRTLAPENDERAMLRRKAAALRLLQESDEVKA